MLPCLCNKQAGLLWLHAAYRCDDAYPWKASPLASFSNKWTVTPVILSLISGGKTNCLHKSQRAVTNVPKKNTTHESLTPRLHRSFSLYVSRAFLLPLSILDDRHDHKTLNTRHTGKVHGLLGVKVKKKVPLLGKMQCKICCNMGIWMQRAVFRVRVVF